MGKIQDDIDNGRLHLPPVFKAMIVADSVGPARYIAASQNGTILVSVNEYFKGGGIAILSGTKNDGIEDNIFYAG